MGKVGRKRKQGERQPNGQLRRPTLSALELAEMSVVLAQPHRRGDRDQRLHCALGRFVVTQKLRKEIYEAGEAYADLVRRWRSAKGVPVNSRASARGKGDGPTDAQVRAWAYQIRAIDYHVSWIVQGDGLNIMRRLILDDRDAGKHEVDEGIAALSAMANQMGYAHDHPFR